MNPSEQDNLNNSQPEATPMSQPPTPKKRTGLALLLLIGPSVLFILAILAAAISNFVFSASSPEASETLFSSEGPAHTIVNVIVFLMGAVTVITWLPGIIIGIILLTKK